MRCQKLPPYWAEPVPVGFKMDLPLDKTEPVNDTGSTTVLCNDMRERSENL